MFFTRKNAVFMRLLAFRKRLKTHIEGKEIKNMEFTEIIKNLYKTIYFIYGRITKHQIGGCI